MLSTIADKGESNSSSSSSLVYDFLRTEDSLLLSLDWLPISPIIPATEAAAGGKYTMGDALHGMSVTKPSSASSGS